MHCAQSLRKMAAHTPVSDFWIKNAMSTDFFYFFDNWKLLLSKVFSFEEVERCNNLSFKDVDQATDRLKTAAETIQLLTSDSGNNKNFIDVASILNQSLIKVRNLIDQLQQYRNEMLDFFGERACRVRFQGEVEVSFDSRISCTWHIVFLPYFGHLCLVSDGFR